MRTNTIKVNLEITEIGLKRFQRTPTFTNLLHPEQLKSLKIGNNELTINHTIWGKLNRLQDNEIKVIKK